MKSVHGTFCTFLIFKMRGKIHRCMFLCDTWQPIHDAFGQHFMWKYDMSKTCQVSSMRTACEFFLCALRRVMGVRKAPFIVNSERIALTSGLRIGGASTRKAGWFALVHLEGKFVTLLVGLIWGHWSWSKCFQVNEHVSSCHDFLTFRPCWRPNSCFSVLICWGKWDVPRRRGVQVILTLKLLRACSSSQSARCD